MLDKRYEGYWKNDRRHGRGLICNYRNECKYYGEWKNG
jgi:hypothetical protein